MRQINRLQAEVTSLRERVALLKTPWKYQIFTADGSIDFKLTEMQKRLHESPYRLNTILKSRQLGITSYCVLRAIYEVIYKPGRVSLIICPSEAQVSVIRGYIDQILANSKLKITYVDKTLAIEDSGKIIFTNSNTDSCRGLACDYIYITEAQDYVDIHRVLESVLPTISTRPNAKVYIDGTMPKTADSSFLQLFGEAVDLIPEARMEEIVDYDGYWILYNKRITRAEVGDAYDREVLLELPFSGTECIPTVGFLTPANVVYQVIFDYRGSNYVAYYYGNGLVKVKDVATLSEIKELLASDAYNTHVVSKIYKMLPSKMKRNATELLDNLGIADDRSEQIFTTSKVTYYLDDRLGVAKSLLARAALCVNGILSNYG